LRLKFSFGKTSKRTFLAARPIVNLGRKVTKRLHNKIEKEKMASTESLSPG